MSDKKIHLVFISIIALLSLLVTVTNLGLSKNFIGDDAGMNYVYPDTLSKSVWYMWDETTFPGKTNTLSTIAFVFAHALLIAYKIGFSSILVERVLYFLFFFASGAGFYFLFNLLAQRGGSQNKFVYFASFTSSLLYSFNYFTTVMASFPITNYHTSYPMLPWLLLLVIKALDKKMGFTTVSALALFTLLLANGNPSNTLSIIVFTIIFVLVFKRAYKFKVKRVATYLILLLTFSSYIYLPILANGSNPYIGNDINLNTASLNFNSIRTSFLNLFRFYGFHSAQDFPFHSLQTSNLFFIYLSFFVPTLLILTFIPNRSSEVMVFFLLFALIFLFLAKGSHSPLSSWFLQFFNNITILQMYRASYYKFIMFVIISFSILLGFATIKIKSEAKLRYLKALLYLLPFLVIVSAWPLLGGRSAKKMYLTEIPDEYKQLGEYMRGSPSDSKVLSVPQIPGAHLKWGENNYYTASYYPDSTVLGRPVWTNSWFNNNLEKYFFDEGGLNRGLDLIKFFNIKYILVHHDVVKSTSAGISSADRISSLLDANHDVEQVSRNRYFSVYEIDKSHYLPHIYLPDIVYITNNFSLDVSETGIPLVSNRKEAVYFARQNKARLNELETFVSSFKVDRKITVEYKKVSPTKYILNVYNATGTFPLVFSESFHTEWKMYVRNNNLEDGSFYETWFRPQLVDRIHFVANGYANSWILNTKDLCRQPHLCTLNNDGTYNLSLVLEFKPQQYFYLGLLISGISIIVTSLVCLIKSRDKS